MGPMFQDSGGSAREPTEQFPGSEAMETLRSQVAHLEAEVERLRRENQDLHIALLTTTEHGDLIEAQLHAANQRLQAEVTERQLAQAALQEILATVLRDKADLELILETTAAHGDMLEYQFYTQAVEAMRQSEEALRKQAEALEQQVAAQTAQLRQAEAKYRSIFENAAEGIFQVTETGHYLSANPTLARILGYDSPAALMTAVTNVGTLYVQPKRREELLVYLRQFGSVSGFESQVYRRDGTIIWISENVRTVHDDAGKICYYEGSVQEITDRRQMEADLREQRQLAERLLLNVLPPAIARRLKQGQTTIAESFTTATVLFADIVDFTALASTTPPEAVVNLLNGIFSTFDQLVDHYRLEKIKTIGDAYMVVGGVPNPQVDQIDAAANLALDMLTAIRQFRTPAGLPLTLRIGIHTGPVVAGVIGTRRFSYDLWGDTVNIASRMESQGKAGCIQVTEVVYQALAAHYELQPRGNLHIKGKGMMRTYWLLGRKHRL
ncbi:PAS domain S-box protein [Trichothermofontia sichuanensis B231]|uniref:adenylate/guanylate cyclase domain-containing protein n=1 Tax=Trichothermofontia sichuanensis TaxID=3045816 RepID=UPI002245EF38|nr:adenylate/guanylate cyclase domain-containing protein [Trichothermofontia sichuanensis]UZQ55431.1 PAS domain S-box protein [Trichothermofontia sichuanensis B231]